MLTAEPEEDDECPVLPSEFCDALTAELPASALPALDDPDDDVDAVGLALGVEFDGDEAVDVPELALPPPALRLTHGAVALPMVWLARVLVGKAGVVDDPLAPVEFVKIADVAVAEFAFKDASADVEAV